MTRTSVRSAVRWALAIACAFLGGLGLAWAWDHWSRPLTGVAMALGLIVAVALGTDTYLYNRDRRRESAAQLRYLQRRGGGL